ncbi:MAG: 3-hydroxyacyl-CoA dehydrogenase/enoyl-CoA hydratase family protein [Methanobacteriota archaeon]
MAMKDVRRVAVIGAGTMGHGIAELCALRGFDVAVHDLKQEFVDRGLREIAWSLEKLAKKQEITGEERAGAMGRVTGTTDLAQAAKGADLVIEAAPESLDLKKKIFADLDRHAPPHAILATNTSGLSVSAMAGATKRPGKVVGLHFFNPVMLMPLLEIVKGDTTDEATLAFSFEFAKKIGKTPVLCAKDVPGFITSRTIGVYMLEAACLLEEGRGTKEQIDAAMQFAAGFPMGPFVLLDQVGNDIAIHAGKDWGVSLGIPANLKRLVEEKRLGKKTGGGWYDWAAGPPKLTPEMGKGFDPLLILAPTINVAAGLVEEGAGTAADIDLAMRLGTAFPKGPLALADDVGLDRVVEVLRAGKRHKPVPILERMVREGKLGKKSGEGFYPHGAAEGRAYESITVERSPSGVATLTLNRPDRLNTLTKELLSEMSRALAALATDPDVRVLVVRGAGDKAFCAGADLTQFVGFGPNDVLGGVGLDTFTELENFAKPTIGAIDGFALGGGCELALALDFRLATAKSQLGQPEIKLGLIPGAGGTQRLPALVGVAKAKELILLGDRILAEEAHRIGLVHRVFPTRADLDKAVAELAERLAKGPPQALKAAKLAVNKSVTGDRDSGLAVEKAAFASLFGTEDLAEGVGAFMAKREAQFKGK